MYTHRFQRLINIFIFCLGVFLCCSSAIYFFSNESVCFAQDINFEVTVDRVKVSLGSSVQLSLNFYGTQNVSAPDLPQIEGFDSRYLGPSSRMSIVNGQVSSSITHLYTLIPLKVGKFTIPSFTVEYKGKQYTSDPIPMEVVQGPVATAPSQGGVSQANTQDLEDRVFIVMQPGKKKAYVNEIIPLTIKLYINKFAVRDIQYPEFEHPGFSVDKFDEPKQYQEVLGGISYNVIEFSTHVFGMHPGDLQLGPATLQCNLILKKESSRRPRSLFDDEFFGSNIFDNFFGGYETYPLSLKSVAIPVTILPLPEAGKPADFKGALGNYNFDLQANPREVKVGDPITLKMTISGEGNLKTVNIPALGLEDNFKVYEPEVKQDQAGKTFEQVIIPKSDTIEEIPRVSFSFFNTATGEYNTVTRGPIPIKVNPLPEGEELKVFGGSTEMAETVRKKENLGRDIIYIKDYPGTVQRKGRSLFKNKLFDAIHLLPLIAIICLLVFQKRKERLQSDVRYARRLRAPRKAKKNLSALRGVLSSGEQAKFFDVAFKTLQEYLGDKLHLSSSSITSSVVESELVPRNIDKGTLDKINNCFNYCDLARYAPSRITKEQMNETFDLLEQIIDTLERAKL